MIGAGVRALGGVRARERAISGRLTRSRCSSRSYPGGSARRAGGSRRRAPVAGCGGRLVVVDAEGRTPVSGAMAGRPLRGRRPAPGTSPSARVGRLRTRPTRVTARERGAARRGRRLRRVLGGARRDRPRHRRTGTSGIDLRSIGPALDALGAGLFTTAVAVLNWHARPGSAQGTAAARPSHARAGTGSAARATRSTRAPIPPSSAWCTTGPGASSPCCSRRNSAGPAGRFSVQAGFVEAGSRSRRASSGRSRRRPVRTSAISATWAARPAVPRSLMIGF